MRYIFARLDENYKLFGNLEKIFGIFDENSIEKLNFYLFLGKVVPKNRAFGNNIIFIQRIFSGSGGGLNPPNHPWSRHCFKGRPRTGAHSDASVFSEICQESKSFGGF